MIETLSEARTAGWRITARCAAGKPERGSRRECHYSEELDLDTLIWTRGGPFPLSELPLRMVCPRCRSRKVVLIFQSTAVSKRAS
ncbi:hypothetical protein [Flaviflagellibacter deserti]|jgi:hypothetical protein|uniref:Uncharacterized protein n=1 Tax=Flaviflagellibacter deserti TaxID=2267266 RepID=A0ABV9YVY2_9HYPH